MYRWDIAYEQQYRCGMCRQLLHPSFEVDHITELCDGGTDTRENCIALCRNCHGRKTRLVRQKRISERHDIINETTSDPFTSFKHISHSPYFSN